MFDPNQLLKMAVEMADSEEFTTLRKLTAIHCIQMYNDLIEGGLPIETASQIVSSYASSMTPGQ